MVLTCPGQRKPRTRTSGASTRARMGGGMSLWSERTKKFFRLSAWASRRAAATVGAVVSKPTPRKTTFRAGSRRARASASRVEYTTRMSAPSARARSREEVEPGTLSRSPKVVMVTPGRAANARAWSTERTGVTQTGHPGPETSRIPSGNDPRRPKRLIAMVWLPQTSMKVTGSGSRTRRSSFRSAAAAAGSRNSST